MKLSKYTFLFEENQTEFYIYSSLSNALIEIDNISYSRLLRAKKEKSDIAPKILNKDLYALLIEKKILVENDTDSFLFYKSVIQMQRTDTKHMHLTIAPTMDCCFSCHYCFEQYKSGSYMTEDVMDSIVKFLNANEHRPEYKLTWFGGEPLMAPSQIEQLYNKLVLNYKKPISSNIITTGFHINADVVRVMQTIGIDQIQITLDGLKNTHNKIKFTSGCDDVFAKVLKNIELVLSTTDIHVLIRVNLTKENANEYVDLYHQLLHLFERYHNIGISPAFVMDRGACCPSSKDDSLFFTHKDAAQFVLDLHNTYHIHSPFLRYPSHFFNECAIRNPSSISFDPEGYAYKCWEVIGNKEYAIGKLNAIGEVENMNHTVLNRHLYGADPMENAVCVNCEYLPICHGGCPIQRIENVFEKKHNCCCTLYKGYMKNFLKIHLAIKKTGFKNV